MEFKKINTRGIVLIFIAVILIVMSIVCNFRHKSPVVDDDPNLAANIAPPVLKAEVSPAAYPPAPSQPFKVTAPEDDDAAQLAMKDQMERDRNQQRQIKMLKMQLEQVDLQLDNEKALTEINKLKKENAGYVKDSSSSIGADFPSIRVIYIGGAETAKEAILSIDGTSYSVKEKDKPVGNVEVLDVTDQGVKVHFNAPHELTTVINYVQD